jgi:hypothetical protein
MDLLHKAILKPFIMKKYLFLFLALFIVIKAQAQLFTIGKHEVGFLYLGPKLGTGGSWMTNSTTVGTETSTLLGYQFGVVGKMGFTEKLSIQPELIYSKKGVKQKLTAGGESETFASYLGIPLLAKLRVIKFNNIKLHGSGGIYTNVALKTKSRVVFNDFEEVYDIERTDYKTVDFGFSFGGGFEYEMKNGILVGELLLEHGTVDMYKDNLLTNSNRNTTLTLAATYLIDFTIISNKLFKKKPGKTED